MGRGTPGEILTRWPARKIYKEFITVDGTGTASITKGAQYATLVDNGTGDYTLTLTYPGAQILNAVVQCFGASARHGQPLALSPSVVNILTFDLATPSAADADFTVELTLAFTDKEF